MSVANLVAVSSLTEALSRALTLDDVYNASLDALRDSLGVNRASVLLFDEHGEMSFVAWRGLSDEYRRAVDGHTPWRPDTRDAQPVSVPDVTLDASLAEYGDVFRAESIRALAFIPLNYRDHVLGKFMLYYEEPHEFTTAELDLARTIAGQIAFGVARVRAEQDLERERRRLADIISSVPGVVWETTGRPGFDHRITFVSEQIAELLGYTVEEWYRNPRFWNDLIVSEDSTPIEQRTTAQKESAPNIHQYRMRTRDGRLIWTEVRSSSKHDGDNVVMRGVTVDITAQKDLETRTRFLNEASEILGSSLDYVSTLSRVADLTVANVADWCAIDVMDHGESRRVTASGPEERPSGDAIEIALRGGGQPIGTLTVARGDWRSRFSDVEHELIAELARRMGYAVENALLYRAARDANRAKDEFLATLSHELRTPMTSTLGWASMLRLRDLPPETTQLAIETIERSTRAQAKLIDDILDVSRIVTGKFELNVSAADVRSIVQKASDAIRPTLEAKDLHLDLSLGTVRDTIKGDPARLQQVLWNLLSNAVKFTPRGGSISVTLGYDENNSIRIEVSDTGIGIPPAFLPFVFDRFRQLDSGSTRTHGGLGLGLAIVKSIVDMHGGSVSARSAGEGKGASFTVTVPNVRVALPDRWAESRPSDEKTLEGVTVLIVEDDTDTRTMLTNTLQQFGASVVSAESVPAAIDIAEIITPHVMVSDIGMPGDDGYSLMMRIRSGEVERLRDVPSIALTAYTRADDREKALSSGFKYHIAKPVDPLLVVKAVEQAARQRS